jgi:hypothetical protein
MQEEDRSTPAHGKDDKSLGHHDPDAGPVRLLSFKVSSVDAEAAVLSTSLLEESLDIEAAVLSRSLSQGSSEDLGAVALEKSLLQGHRSGLAAPGWSLLTKTRDAAALDSCLRFSVAVAALLDESSLEVVVPALLDVYLEATVQNTANRH